MDISAMIDEASFDVLLKVDLNEVESLNKFFGATSYNDVSQIIFAKKYEDLSIIQKAQIEFLNNNLMKFGVAFETLYDSIKRCYSKEELKEGICVKIK